MPKNENRLNRINEELKKEIINFLSNISSVTEIDEDIIKRN